MFLSLQVPSIVSGDKSNSINGTTESNKNSTKGTETVVVSTENKDDSDSNIGDISISKFSELSNTTLSQHNITKMEYDTHQYYNSTFIIDEAVGKKYWVDINNHPDLKVNYLLSQSHRRAAVSIICVFYFVFNLYYTRICSFLNVY